MSIELDVRQLAFAEIGKKYHKQTLNEMTKQAIRNKDYTIKFGDYGAIKLEKQTDTTYIKDGEKISIDTTQIVKDYCDAHGIEVIKETKADYKIKILPSDKAYCEYEKMCKELENSQHKNIAKIGTQMRNV